MSRPRLLDFVDAAVDSAALTLVTAGPGGGKSVLLADWAHRRPVPPAWLAVTRADNDPTRFWQLFLRAVRPTGSLPLPTAWSGDAVPGLLDSLFGEEPYGAPPAVVVIDDAHLLTDRAVIEGLDRLVLRWSDRVRLVMASRSQPLLPLHRYRLSGQLAELRAADLAMTREEAAALFAAHGAALTDEEVDRVVARTEGWTGGLRLIALRTEGTAFPARIIHELALDQGSIGEYLVSEVLSVLPDRTRRLLMETCFLDEVSGEAAEAITGIEGAADILADLARANSFVVPLDSSFTRFRYHHLFGEFLRLLVRRRRDPELLEADARAIAWFRLNRDIAGAVQWALRRGDHHLACRVLVRGGLAELVVSGPASTSLPLEELARDDGSAAGEGHLLDDAESSVARVAVAALRSYRDAGGGGPVGELRRPDPAVPAPAVPAPAVPEPDDPELRVTVLLTRLLSAWGEDGHAAASETIDRLLSDDLADAVAPVPGLHSKLLLLRARSSFAAGRMAEVEPRLVRALAAAEAEQAIEVALEILGVLALATASAGRPQHTADALGRAAELLRRHPEITAPPWLAIAEARHAHLQADLAAMAEAMNRALAAGPIYLDRGMAATVAYLRALLLSATDRVEEARRWLRAPVLNGADLGLLEAMRDAELARIEVALGRPDRALALLQPYEDGPYSLATAVPSALASLAAGNVAEAERRLHPVFTDPSPQVDRHLLVAAFLCQAQLMLCRGDDTRALDAVARARELAGDDVVMPFVRATRALAPLLARHPEAAARWPAAAQPPPEAVEPARAPVDRLPEPLTEREKCVLRLLTTAMSIAEISGELFLSVNTVKTHVSAIYRKLGVTRRRDAVQCARQLELL